MHNLNLPSYRHKLKQDKGQDLIFDEFRRKWLKLTPEEWVRQHLAHYLVNFKHYPTGLMAIEYQLKLNQMVKRSDIVCFNHQKKVVLIGECKAPTVKISQSVFDQIIQYNFHFRSSYLLVSNGLQHYCCYVDFKNNKVNYLEDIPVFEDTN